MTNGVGFCPPFNVIVGEFDFSGLANGAFATSWIKKSSRPMHLLNRETMVFRDQETSHDQKLKGYILHRRHFHLELCPARRLGIQRRHPGCGYALAVAG
jgi:hypothetical protein